MLLIEIWSGYRHLFFPKTLVLNLLLVHMIIIIDSEKKVFYYRFSALVSF